MATSVLAPQRYSPEPPPNPEDKDFPRKLVDYLKREYERISDALKKTDVFNFEAQFVAIPKPQEGDVAYADGVSWNPGAGVGLYQYRSAAWVKLG